MESSIEDVYTEGDVFLSELQKSAGCPHEQCMLCVVSFLVPQLIASKGDGCRIGIRYR
jgi:hypothetical protein